MRKGPVPALETKLDMGKGAHQVESLTGGFISSSGPFRVLGSLNTLSFRLNETKK